MTDITTALAPTTIPAAISYTDAHDNPRKVGFEGGTREARHAMRTIAFCIASGCLEGASESQRFLASQVVSLTVGQPGLTKEAQVALAKAILALYQGMYAVMYEYDNEPVLPPIEAGRDIAHAFLLAVEARESEG